MLARLMVPGSLVRIKRIKFLRGDLLPWIRSVTPLLMGNPVCLYQSLSELPLLWPDPVSMAASFGESASGQNKTAGPSTATQRSTRRVKVLFVLWLSCMRREQRTGLRPSYSTHGVPRLRRRKHGAPVQGKGRCRILGITLERGAARSLDKSDSRFTRRPSFDGTVQ
jgi:hypothetical protein